MLTKIALGLFTLVLVTINVYFFYHLYSKKTLNQPISNGQSALAPQPIPILTFTGTVSQGQSLDSKKSSCPNGIYLVLDKDQNNLNQGVAIQLRSPDTAKVDGQELYRGYFGLLVSVTGKFNNFDNTAYSELNCFSDDYILVDKIITLSRENTSLKQNGVISLAGTIVCLPTANSTQPNPADCVLGLMANNQYYTLLNLKDDLLLTKNSQLQVTGTLVKDFTSPHPQTLGFTVITAKPI